MNACFCWVSVKRGSRLREQAKCPELAGTNGDGRFIGFSNLLEGQSYNGSGVRPSRSNCRCPWRRGLVQSRPGIFLGGLVNPVFEGGFQERRKGRNLQWNEGLPAWPRRVHTLGVGPLHPDKPTGRTPRAGGSPPTGAVLKTAGSVGGPEF